MRIAFDTFNLGAAAGSGNKTYTVELIKALGNMHTADEWQLITYWRKKRVCGSIFGEHPRRIIKSCIPHPRLFGNHVTLPAKALAAIGMRMVARQCDLFHCTNPIQFPFSMPRVVTTIHDLIGLRNDEWASPGSKDFYRANLGKIVARSQCIFSNSAFTKRELVERYPVFADRIIVTPLAADQRFFAQKEKSRAFLRRFGITDPQCPYLLNVGDIQPRKNIAGMLRAFESLDERFKEVRFIIIGRTKGPLSERIIKALNASPKRDRIHLINNAADDDLVDFYNNAIGFVYYSFFEGFGLPVVEAMQCGCPVATADSSALTEIAKGAALIVDPHNLDAMREAMIHLIDNDSLRNDLKKRGLERAAGFSWKMTAEITYRGYKNVLGIG